MRISLGRGMQIALDVLVLTVSLALAVLLRYDKLPEWHQAKPVLLCAPYIIALQYGFLVGFGVHRFAWRFIGLREAVRVLVALGAAAACLLAIRLAIPFITARAPVFRNALVPYGVTGIDLILAFCGVTGVRGMRRLQLETLERDSRPKRERPAVRTLLVGAGSEGLAVAREVSARPDLGLELVGFVDDEPARKGTRIHGLLVHAGTKDIATLCARLDVKQLLITIAEPSADMLRSILEQCERCAVAAKIVPGLPALVAGRGALGAIRDVAIEDLLRRPPVRLDTQSIGRFLTDRVVMVTGAGGSIGSEICRQVARFGPKSLVLVERSELALFEIFRELDRGSPEVQIVPAMADVCDVERMRSILSAHRPTVLFHAAAHKHVPLMEGNVGEAIKNNLGGTKVAGDLALEHGVESFVMISTDKAVNPTSVMGATKRASELYLQALANRSATRFTAVRFGNVLGSSGSVLPLFREQIASGGPVRVTHPEMRRYFMTIPEACQLVMQAGTMGGGGEIFVLDMGKPVRIVDLATDLIRLSGLVPEVDIKLEFVGMRPGEKLFEELAFDDEHVAKTEHESIFIGHFPTVDGPAIERAVCALLARVDTTDESALRRILRSLVPEFSGAPEATPARDDERVVVCAPPHAFDA